MKFVLSALSVGLMSFSTYAARPSLETFMVARVLANNPDITKQLKDNLSDSLWDYEKVEVRPGVSKYTLVFGRVCECLPSTATVTIFEDMNPTYTNGLISYTSSIVIK